MDCCLWEEILKNKTKQKPSWPTWKLMKRMQTEETNIVIGTKISKVLTNHQSDHVMSSCLLLLTVLRGVPGLSKHVLLLFWCVQLTHWDKLHRSTGRAQLPEGLCRTASSYLGRFLLFCNQALNKDNKAERRSVKGKVFHCDRPWHY